MFVQRAMKNFTLMEERKNLLDLPRCKAPQSSLDVRTFSNHSHSSAVITDHTWRSSAGLAKSLLLSAARPNTVRVGCHACQGLQWQLLERCEVSPHFRIVCLKNMFSISAGCAWTLRGSWGGSVATLRLINAALHELWRGQKSCPSRHL